MYFYTVSLCVREQHTLPARLAASPSFSLHVQYGQHKKSMPSSPLPHPTCWACSFSQRSSSTRTLRADSRTCITNLRKCGGVGKSTALTFYAVNTCTHTQTHTHADANAPAHPQRLSKKAMLWCSTRTCACTHTCMHAHRCKRLPPQVAVEHAHTHTHKCSCPRTPPQVVEEGLAVVHLPAGPRLLAVPRSSLAHLGGGGVLVLGCCFLRGHCVCDCVLLLGWHAV